MATLKMLRRYKICSLQTRATFILSIVLTSYPFFISAILDETFTNATGNRTLKCSIIL